MLSPDNDEVQILGRDLIHEAKFIKQGIGIVPQDIAVFEEITAEQNVSL